MQTGKLFRTALTERQAKNSALNSAECEEGKTVLASYPRRIVFELTNKCNYSCVMCGREAADFRTLDLPFPVIKACEPFLGCAEEATLFGWGEGTLHPGFRDILEYLDTYHLLRKYFVTNGSTIPKIMDSVFEHRVDLIAVSLDGATPETNDSIRKGGSFEREVRSLRRLVEEKHKRGLTYPYINFVFTAMARNIHELPMMVGLASDIGIPEVKAVYLTAFDEGLLGESLYNMQDIVKRYFTEARELAEKTGVNLKLPDIQGESEAGDLPHRPCAFAWRDLYIGSDGYLRPCQSSAEKLLNISDFEGFDDIWNSGEMQAFRLRVNDPKLMSNGCLNCYQSTCANWNMRHSFLRFGTAFSPVWKEAAALANPAENDGGAIAKTLLESPGPAPVKGL